MRTAQRMEFAVPDMNLSTILPDRKGNGDKFPAEFMEMQAMRRAFLRSWAAWIGTGPIERDIRDEAESTASAFRQIRELDFAPEPRQRIYHRRVR